MELFIFDIVLGTANIGKKRTSQEKNGKFLLEKGKKRIFAAVIKTWQAALIAQKAKALAPRKHNATMQTEAKQKSSPKELFFMR